MFSRRYYHDAVDEHPLVPAAVLPDGGRDGVPGAGGPHRVGQPPHPGSRVLSRHMMVHFILISHYIILTYVTHLGLSITCVTIILAPMSPLVPNVLCVVVTHFWVSCSFYVQIFLQSCNRILYGQSLAAYYCLSCELNLQVRGWTPHLTD